jgi:hypothetical protein
MMMATTRPRWRSEGANVGAGQSFNLVQFFYFGWGGAGVTTIIGVYNSILWLMVFDQ